MKNFRFRLDPVVRLKQYQIEQVEDEIRELERQVQIRLEEIEEGRRAVQAMRQLLLEETNDAELVKAERKMDLFREYTWKVENEKREEIKKIRDEQEVKRKRLVKLYQDEKVLERLKERRKNEWDAQNRREETAIMDEIGSQKYIRKKSGQLGGALPYVLAVVFVVSLAAIAGIYTGKIDKRYLHKIPFLGKESTPIVQIQDATPTVSIDTYTPKELLGDLDTPMDRTLQNIIDWRDKLNKKEEELNRREKDLDQRETLIDRKNEDLIEYTGRITDCIEILQDLRKQRDERNQSQLNQFEEELTLALAGAKEKEVVRTLLNMYLSPGTDNEEISEQNRLLSLRVLHRFSERPRSAILEEMSKQNPNAAARVAADFATLTDDELNKK